MTEQIRIEQMYGDIHLGASDGNLDSQTVKLAESDKKWVNDIAQAVSQSTGRMKYGASSVIREAISFYRDFYHVARKLLKYKKAVIAFLDNLP